MAHLPSSCFSQTFFPRVLFPGALFPWVTFKETNHKKGLTMECHPRILKERTVIRGSTSETVIMFYCSILGEIVLTGERAEEARRRLKDAQGDVRNPFSSPS